VGAAEAIEVEEVEIGPNDGPQSVAFASTADITVYGGAAGSGKSFLTLLRFGVHADQYPGYQATIFRREMPMVTQGGGLWDESLGLYPIWGAKSNSANFKWHFPERSVVQFRGLKQVSDAVKYQGAQFAEFCFEEATHFEESQFWYLFSRLRTKLRRTHGFKARCMLTCNPDPDSWVRKLIDWWIGEDGFPIRERAGKKRFFIRDGNDLVWADSVDELRKLVGPLISKKNKPKSVRFIPALLADNPQGDPDYESTLNALHQIERDRLLGGNWNVRAVAGSFFKRGYFQLIDFWPGQVKRRVRAWDLAATKPHEGNKDPDWTVGLKVAELDTGKWLIEHAERFRESPGAVDDAILNIARQDGVETIQLFWRDPGQAGKSQEDHIVKLLKGFHVKFVVASKDKQTYAGPVSSFAEHQQIMVMRGSWNEPFFGALEAFPTKGVHDDDVDALSRASLEFFPGEAEYDQAYDAYLPTFRNG
jgi:predicted phage terminase large subunit-like protein